MVILDKIHPVLIEKFARKGLNCVDVSEKPKTTIYREIKTATGIVVRSKIVLSEEILKKCESLKFIGRVGSGLENIDLKYCKKNNISVYNSPEGNRTAVAEHSLAMLLCLLNNISITQKEIEKGVWERDQNSGTELSGKTIGIIGYGNNGSALADVLSGFNVRILVYDKYKKIAKTEGIRQTELREIQKEADIISINIPLNKETKECINKKFIKAFKKPIYIINISRGQIVKTKDLVEAIKNNKVIGACLDVLEYESNDFYLNFQNQNEELQYLIKSPNVLITPHIAGLTQESYYKLSAILAEKILTEYQSNTP